MLYHKGAGEIVLQNCSTYLDSDGSVKKITDSKRRELEQMISIFASQALRCVALAHRKNPDQAVSPATCTVEECEEKLEENMTLDALVGIVDLLRPDMVESIKTCLF